MELRLPVRIKKKGEHFLSSCPLLTSELTQNEAVHLG
jgi:hypothetical protein